MPQYTAPLDDFKFIIRDFLNVEQHKDMPGFSAAFDLIDPVLEEGGKFCQEVLFPLNQSGDEEGLKHDKATGSVTMPKGFKEAYAQYVAGGWPAFTCDSEYGGQGLPEWLGMPMIEMICSANLSFGITPGLSHGFYNALALHGSDALKKQFLPKIVTGEWSGVMGLTEPQAGTDLGLIRTKAEPLGTEERMNGGTEEKDSSSPHILTSSVPAYRITGGKIFISSGEQDMTDNILHLVLARLPDAPAGTKGISLFLVPKIMVNDDGSLGERNKVRCEGIEHKMGIHASPTCVMNYDNAVGYLVGEPHKGMKAMFTMMNAARLYVGVQGLGLGEVAMQNAYAYARERLQSRHIKGAKFPDKAADPIIEHADVKRMLLTCRAFTEGARALAMETALQLDISKRHPDEAVREQADHYVQLMTPIIKAYMTDGGSETANIAVQVFGGYGYIREYGVEQYVRDARIAQIYEGTNGVQALDLVGRKLPYGTGKYLRRFFHPVDKFIAEHKGNPKMAEFTKPLYVNLKYLQQGTLWIATRGFVNPDDAAAGATEYLKLFALVVIADMWARQAAIALKKLEEGAENKEFYEQKLNVARFYMAKVLPQTTSLLASITAGIKAVKAA